MQCELEGRESSSGCLVGGWPKGSGVQQTMGRGRRPFLSIWQLTQGLLKKREQTSRHTSDVFPGFCSDVDDKGKNGSAERGREEHKRYLELRRNLWKRSREAPAAPGKQPWAWQGWACGWASVGCGSLGVPCEHGQGSWWPETLPCSHKNWWAVSRAAGRKDNMKSLICLQEWEGGLKSKRDGQDLSFLLLMKPCNFGHLPALCEIDTTTFICFTGPWIALSSWQRINYCCTCPGSSAVKLSAHRGLTSSVTDIQQSGDHSGH